MSYQDYSAWVTKTTVHELPRQQCMSYQDDSAWVTKTTVHELPRRQCMSYQDDSARVTKTTQCTSYQDYSARVTKTTVHELPRRQCMSYLDDSAGVNKTTVRELPVGSMLRSSYYPDPSHSPYPVCVGPCTFRPFIRCHHSKTNCQSQKSSFHYLFWNFCSKTKSGSQLPVSVLASKSNSRSWSSLFILELPLPIRKAKSFFHYSI